ELAGAVELLRGPGTAVHGSNALHGVIDLRAPRIDAPARMRLTQAGFDHRQVLLGLPGGSAGRPLRVDIAATEAGSFRDDEGHAQQRVLAQLGLPHAPGSTQVLFSAQALDQDTAGYVTGDRAYADARRRLNPNPEAYRKARSARLSAHWRFALGSG